jgi:hypothetical protein
LLISIHLRWDFLRLFFFHDGFAVQEVEVYQVVNAADVPVFEEFLIKEAVLAEVLAEIQEYAFSLLLQVDLVASDAVGPVVDRERCDFFSPSCDCRGVLLRCWQVL